MGQCVWVSLCGPGLIKHLTKLDLWLKKTWSHFKLFYFTYSEPRSAYDSIGLILNKAFSNEADAPSHWLSLWQIKCTQQLRSSKSTYVLSILLSAHLIVRLQHLLLAKSPRACVSPLHCCFLVNPLRVRFEYEPNETPSGPSSLSLSTTLHQTGCCSTVQMWMGLLGSCDTLTLIIPKSAEMLWSEEADGTERPACWTLSKSPAHRRVTVETATLSQLSNGHS